MLLNYLLIFLPISKLILLLTYWKLSDTDPRYIIKNLLHEPCFSNEKKIVVVREVGILVEDESLLLTPSDEILKLKPDSFDVNDPKFNTVISPIGKDIVSNLTPDSNLHVRLNKKGRDEIIMHISLDKQNALKLADVHRDLRLSRVIDEILALEKKD